ncbi:MAG: transcription termination factor Rho, partial [Spirochaetes bacterium]|nr:transcription termination factor Rho [Spirochaetota bacterium]
MPRKKKTEETEKLPIADSADKTAVKDIEKDSETKKSADPVTEDVKAGIKEPEKKEEKAGSDKKRTDVEQKEVRHERYSKDRKGHMMKGRKQKLREDLDKTENLDIGRMKSMNLDDLMEMAVEMGVSGLNAETRKDEVITAISQYKTEKAGLLYVTGVLEILPEGYGFLRSVKTSYLQSIDDVYISPSQIKLFGLRTGDSISGQVRSPKENERYYAMLKVESINYDLPEHLKHRFHFDALTPLYPEERLNLETDPRNISTRIMNLMTPIGKGQRGLIVSPPRAGKTILLQDIANSITVNHPEVIMIVLLIDERPEEVTDMKRNVRAEVVSS